MSWTRSDHPWRVEEAARAVRSEARWAKAPDPRRLAMATLLEECAELMKILDEQDNADRFQQPDIAEAPLAAFAEAHPDRVWVEARATVEALRGLVERLPGAAASIAAAENLPEQAAKVIISPSPCPPPQLPRRSVRVTGDYIEAHAWHSWDRIAGNLPFVAELPAARCVVAPCGQYTICIVHLSNSSVCYYLDADVMDVERALNMARGNTVAST